jgi:tetratricopeptide (TPR) repeat protein
LPAHETRPKARAAATRALELDGTLGEPHAALGMTKAFFDWNWADGEAELRRAIQLNQNYATAFHWLAILLQAQGRFHEALARARRGRELDPLSPIINVTVGQLLFESGQEEAGIQLLQEQIALDPGFVVAHYELGKYYLLQGKIPHAILEIEKAHSLYQDDAYEWALRACAYLRAGRRQEAQQILDQLLEYQRRGHTVSLLIASVHRDLGNDAQALDFLEQAAEERSTSLCELYASPFWKDLQPHPRAQAILRRMNLVK